MAIRMTPADAVWYLGETPENPMMISSILWLDRPLDVRALRERMAERILERHPVMRMRIVPSPVPGVLPRWVEDPDFEVARHVIEERLPDPGDHAALEDWCSRERSTPLRRDRPLWQLTVLQGYRGTQTAIHSRIHHSIGDGLALMQVMMTLVDEYQPGALRISDAGWTQMASELLGFGREMLANGSKLARHPLGVVDLAKDAANTAGWAVKLLAPQMVDRSVLQGVPEGRKVMAWDPEGFDLDELKAAARANGVTINDLVLAAMSGGLHRYLDDHDDLVDDVLVMIPINLRAPGAPLPRQLGNRIGLLPVRLPVRSDDPLERLTLLRERMNELKASPAPVVSRMLMAGTSLATPSVEKWIHRMNQLRGTGVITNVPGPRIPLHLLGAELLGTVGWGGMTGHLNLSAAFISLGGRIFPGLVTDAAITPDPGTMLHYVQVEHRRLLDALPAPPQLEAVTT